MNECECINNHEIEYATEKIKLKIFHAEFQISVLEKILFSYFVTPQILEKIARLFEILFISPKLRSQILFFQNNLDV